MSDISYLVSLALLQQGDERVMPIGGKSIIDVIIEQKIEDIKTPLEPVIPMISQLVSKRHV